MNYLVIFEDGVHYVCKENRITNKRGDQCTVKYSNGCRYPAQIMDSNANMTILEDLKNKLSVPQNSTNLKEKNKNISTPTINDSFELSVTNGAGEAPFSATFTTIATQGTNDSFLLQQNIDDAKKMQQLPENASANTIETRVSTINEHQHSETIPLNNTAIFMAIEGSTEFNFSEIVSTPKSDMSPNSCINANDEVIPETDDSIANFTFPSGSISLNILDDLLPGSTPKSSLLDIENNNDATKINIPQHDIQEEERETINDFSQQSMLGSKEIDYNTSITHSNCSDNESDYEPSVNNSDEESSANESTDEEHVNKTQNRSQNSKQSSTANSSLEVSFTVNVPGRSTRDDADMYIQLADNKKGQTKRSFCMYCHKMQSKLVRHLEVKHKDIDDVKKFSDLPKNNAERLKIIDTIRKNCMFYFNTNNTVNDGELMVVRRPNISTPRMAKDYKVCQNCKGFFSKNNIRHHAKKCFGYNGKKTRTLQVMGRKIIGRIHEDASEILRKEIFPVLREDDIVRLIRYDRLIILYGNKLCAKYGNLQHQHDMIRAHLRLLGRFLVALKQINQDVTDFASLYYPRIYNDAISAIHIVAGYDYQTKNYKSPSTAYTIGSLLKKIAHFYIFDCITREDNNQKLKTEDFLKLLTEDIGISVNKPVMESQTLQKRRKTVQLPPSNDIRTLHNYLKQKRIDAYQSLEKGFTYASWLMLAQATLISVQLFNRRRAGEIERVFIEDFRNYQGIEKDELKNMSTKSKKIASNYVRFTIRGKLNRTVPVLLSCDLLNCIEMILKHRDTAKVSSKNQYIFGIPGSNHHRQKYLRACFLMRKFAKEAGVDFPHKLTGTTLRKHIATNCINLNLSENEIADVAKFMGHAEKIHREHYRQPIVSREILRISKVLESVQGVNNDEDDEDETDSETEDNEEVTPSSDNANKGRSKVSNNLRGYSKANSDRSSEPEISENSDISKSNKPKKRSVSPYGPVGTKKRWSTEERDTAFQLFGEYIKRKTYPSLKEIQEKCKKNPSLSGRKPAIIKTWISNQIKKTSK